MTINQWAKSSIITSFAFCLSYPAWAEPAENVEHIYVQGVRQSLQSKGRLADTLQKTEQISNDDLFELQAVNLSEAIDSAAGIRVNNECSMCGIKRVMINGLKGEHTTILVDGVPMHSVVSSYYGIDALGTAGIESIEIARGPGASLTAPEAIGGTINIVTKKPRENAIDADFSLGENGYINGAVAATAYNKEHQIGLLLTGQYYDQDQQDNDDNGVSETPSMKNNNLSMKISWDLTPKDNLEVRLATFKSDIFGGPTSVGKSGALASVAEGDTPANQFFTDGDVRKRFLGKPWETTEAIDTTRHEFSANWLHSFSDDLNLQTVVSYIEHKQDSFYEGFDYRNDDDILFADVRLDYYLSRAHLLTFGVDARTETMDSDSNKLLELQQTEPELTGDDFDYDYYGFYIQDDWTPTPMLQISMALRIDKITADFKEHKDVGNEIDKTLVTPRLHIRWDHSDEWVSRLGLGTGYRAPLTFFESDHGILEDGFDIAVDHLEQSKSIDYSLAYDNGKLAATFSADHTEIDHLSYIDTSGTARPTLRNSDHSSSVSTFDLMWNYQLIEGVNLNGGFEYFDYSKQYRQTFSVIPIEQRITLGTDIDLNGFDWVINATWIGSRDLTDYGISGRYNIFNDLNGNNQVDAGEMQGAKDTSIESYITLDTKLSYAINDILTGYVGVNNLLDYTQVDDMDSPLFWEDSAGEASYDVANIYGPLAGRQFYAGFKLSL